MDQGSNFQDTLRLRPWLTKPSCQVVTLTQLRNLRWWITGYGIDFTYLPKKATLCEKLKKYFFDFDLFAYRFKYIYNAIARWKKRIVTSRAPLIETKYLHYSFQKSGIFKCPKVLNSAKTTSKIRDSRVDLSKRDPLFAANGRKPLKF